jgi:LacI family transcriptional regulator
MAKQASITVKELAQRANVSVATVSRVLNGREYVSDDVRQRVLEIVAEAGYEPDFMARSLRTRATNTVGFIVRDLLDLVFAAMAQGADSVLSEHGYTMLLATSGLDPQLDTRRFAHLRQRRVDGFILAVSDERNAKLIEEMSRTDAPVVLVDREMPQAVADTVVTDYDPGTLAAVSHLYALGHRRIAYIGGDDRLLPGRARWRALQDAFTANGLRLSDALVRRGSFATDFGYTQMLDVLERPNRPTAVIAGGNQIAIGVLHALNERGISIPEQMSVIGYDDTDAMRVGTAPVSVISRSLVDTGRLAAEQLLLRIQEQRRADPPSDSVRIAVPTRFEVRSSCRAIDPEKE